MKNNTPHVDLAIEQDKKFKAILSCEENKAVQYAIQKYIKTGRPYAVPTLDKIKKIRSSDRRRDMVGGYPYTSQKHPWPKWQDSNIPMQPVFQINLGTIGMIIGENVGGGLAQIWGRVADKKEGVDFFEIAYSRKFDDAIFLRIISEDDLKDDPISDQPDEYSNSFGEPRVQVDSLDFFFSLKEKYGEGAYLSWKEAGLMCQYPDRNVPFEEYLEGANDEFAAIDHDDWESEDRFWEKITDQIDNPRNAPEIYAGGYGGINGLDDPSFNEEVVMSIAGAGDLGLDQMNVSLVLNRGNWVSPNVKESTDSTAYHFPLESKLKAVFSMPGRNY